MMDAKDWCNNGVEGLFNEGEEIIANDGDCAYWYAVYCLRRRFKIGEKAIKVSNEEWTRYSSKFKL